MQGLTGEGANKTRQIVTIRNPEGRANEGFKTGTLNRSATLPVCFGTFYSRNVPQYQDDNSAACVRDR